jgi:hypothetical protein
MNYKLVEVSKDIYETLSTWMILRSLQKFHLQHYKAMKHNIIAYRQFN